jgi:GNAT superfamily N-acetyltransferase
MKLMPVDHTPERRVRLGELMTDYLLEQEIEKGGPSSVEKIRHEASQYLHEYIGDEEHHFFLFSRGHQYIGFAELTEEEVLLPEEDVPEPALRVISFYIAPAWRRQKIGSHFFSLLRTWGHELHVTLIEIELPGYLLGANKFLEAQGFEMVTQGDQNLYRIYI